MKPKKGDLTFEQNIACKELLLWEQEAHGSNYNLATPADLASMGLVLRKDYEELWEKSCRAAQILCAEPAPHAYSQWEPQPTHRFKVGDKVRVIGNTGIRHYVPLNEEVEIIELKKKYQGYYGGKDFIYRVDYETQCIVESDLELVNDEKPFTPPPMPIRLGWGLCDDGNLEFMGIQNTLEAWIPFVEEITGWTDALKWLLELQEWRKKWGTQ